MRFDIRMVRDCTSNSNSNIVYVEILRAIKTKEATFLCLCRLILFAQPIKQANKCLFYSLHSSNLSMSRFESFSICFFLLARSHCAHTRIKSHMFVLNGLVIVNDWINKIDKYFGFNLIFQCVICLFWSSLREKKGTLNTILVISKQIGFTVAYLLNNFEL